MSASENVDNIYSYSVFKIPLYVLVIAIILFSSVQFSRSVVSDSLRSHELQHASLPCPSPTSGVHPDSCPLSQWCHPAISSSVVSFSSCPPSLPASESFPMNQLFAWGGQSTGVSASASFPPKKSQGLISFRMDWLDLLAVQGTLKSLLQHRSSKASILWSSAFFTVQLSHPYMTTGKTIALTRRTFVGKVMSLLFNMLPRLNITSLPRSKRLNFMATVTICSESFIIQTKCLHPAFSPIEDIIEAHMLRICSHWGKCLISLWNLLRSGIKPVSCVGQQILYHWATREAL